MALVLEGSTTKRAAVKQHIVHVSAPPSQAWLRPNFQEQSMSCCSEKRTPPPVAIQYALCSAAVAPNAQQDPQVALPSTCTAASQPYFVSKTSY